MSTIKVDTIQNTSGVQQYLAKAWVNFNGTGTVAIRADGNVSSITDNGVGYYSVNFSTAMVDVNFAISGMGSAVTTDARYQLEAFIARSSTSFRFVTTNSSAAAVDGTYVSSVCSR